MAKLILIEQHFLQSVGSLASKLKILSTGNLIKNYYGEINFNRAAFRSA